jgi:hypothetical protein
VEVEATAGRAPKHSGSPLEWAGDERQSRLPKDDGVRRKSFNHAFGGGDEVGRCESLEDLRARKLLEEVTPRRLDLANNQMRVRKQPHSRIDSIAKLSHDVVWSRLQVWATNTGLSGTLPLPKKPPSWTPGRQASGRRCTTRPEKEAGARWPQQFTLLAHGELRMLEFDHAAALLNARVDQIFL